MPIEDLFLPTAAPKRGRGRPPKTPDAITGKPINPTNHPKPNRCPFCRGFRHLSWKVGGTGEQVEKACYYCSL
jgi:hypothetical protein